MKTYQSHKQVQAAKVVGATRMGEHMLVDVEGEIEPITVTAGPVTYKQPSEMIGGYLVRYPDSDSYISWSPAKAFEDGYTEVKPMHDVPAP